MGGKWLWNRDISRRSLPYFLGRDKFAVFFSKHTGWSDDIYKIYKLDEGEEKTIGEWNGGKGEQNFKFQPDVPFEFKKKILAGFLGIREDEVVAYLI